MLPTCSSQPPLLLKVLHITCMNSNSYTKNSFYRYCDCFSSIPSPPHTLFFQVAGVSRGPFTFFDSFGRRGAGAGARAGGRGGLYQWEAKVNQKSSKWSGLIGLTFTYLFLSSVCKSCRIPKRPMNLHNDLQNLPNPPNISQNYPPNHPQNLPTKSPQYLSTW